MLLLLLLSLLLVLGLMLLLLLLLFFRMRLELGVLPMSKMIITAFHSATAVSDAPRSSRRASSAQIPQNPFRAHSR